VQVIVDEQAIHVRLSAWQKLLGLMRDVTVARSAVRGVEVLEDPLAEPMSCGLKVGLRLPWLYYAARTIRLDQMFIVRRGVPALAFDVEDGSPLRRVLLSTPQARELATQLRPERV
jgi:hypothetical protein